MIARESFKIENLSSIKVEYMVVIVVENLIKNKSDLSRFPVVNRTLELG